MSNRTISHPNATTVQSLLELIEGINSDIEEMKKLQSETTRELMVRQLEHLKKDLSQQLIVLLERYRLPLQVRMAA